MLFIIVTNVSEEFMKLLKYVCVNLIRLEIL